MSMYKNRTYCGEITRKDVGNRVELYGWIDRKRDLGGITFIEIRDVSGVVQVVINASDAEASCLESAERVRSEYCVRAVGTVRERSPETVNRELATGEIEIKAEALDILNPSELPPFMIDYHENLSEDLRLKYRFLDLRREEMRDAIVLRHKVMRAARNYLSDNRFIEIETPMLNKSTPEGARDFLVPSRINRGMFYALPQSPQLFKQILMVSGFDRYFQIVKCFRDEDLRNDRQPEFTQIDLEMSFIDTDMVMEVIEGSLEVIVDAALGRKVSLPFSRMTYDEAMLRFGKDAPDTRFGLELADLSGVFSNSQFTVFSSALASRGTVKGFSIPGGDAVSRKMIDDYGEFAKIYRAKGLPWVRCRGGAFEGGIAKYLNDTEQKALVEIFGNTDNSLLFFAADSPGVVNDTLGNLRIKIARDLSLIDEDALNFVWITDFPLLEYGEEDGRFYAKHHPFTAPIKDHVKLLDSLTPENVEDIKAQAYDIVLNGVEIGGGSIRISDTATQKKIFTVLGISEEEAKIKFSFLLDALKYGAPPHGGIALGLDRIMMILLKKASIRDVIAFPKTQKGQCLMSEAPSPVSMEQLKELSIKPVER